MRVCDDCALLGLPENRVEPDSPDDLRVDQVAEDLPGPDGGKLVDVADKDELRLRLHGGEERRTELDVDHRNFVDNKHITLKRRVGVAPEHSRLRFVLQQPMNRFCFTAGQF